MHILILVVYVYVYAFFSLLLQIQFLFNLLYVIFSVHYILHCGFYQIKNFFLNVVYQYVIILY